MSKRFSPNSRVDAKTIGYSGFIVVDEFGNMELTRRTPGLKPGQRSIAVVLSVPRSIFKIPSLRAEISVPEQGADVVIVKAITALKDAAAGAGLNLTVVPRDDD